MSQLMDLVGSYLNDENVDRISRSLGSDRSKTEKAISAALPTLVGAMTRNANDPSKQERLHQALVRDHDGSLFDHLGSFLGPGDDPVEQPGLTKKTTSGGAILDHLLGNRRGRVEQGVSSASGLDSGQSVKLMSMLAPLLMGALGKKRRDGDLSAGGLGDLLQSERQSVESEPATKSLLGRMFDQDGDGDFDLMDIVKLGFGRMFKR
ncbi:MAG: DUF937 domain-containing protein [Planctomycetota bacterium]